MLRDLVRPSKLLRHRLHPHLSDVWITNDFGGGTTYVRMYVGPERDFIEGLFHVHPIRNVTCPRNCISRLAIRCQEMSEHEHWGRIRRY